MVFVDTNVLLYCEDAADPGKQQRAVDWMRVLWTRRCGRLSAQVLGEFYANATRKLRPPMQAGDARAEVRRYQRWQPWQLDQPTVETAWAIESHNQQFDGVRVINPFLLGPEVLDTSA